MEWLRKLFDLLPPNENRILKQVRAAPGPAARVELCEQALQHVRQKDNATLWGRLHYLLAASVGETHEHRYTEPIFQKVLEGYQTALSAFSPTQSPSTWAATLINIGRTHLAAVESGLGDKTTHVEAAINAFVQAGTVSSLAAPSERISALYHQVSALRAAAPWRGPDVLFEIVTIYHDILSTPPADLPPEAVGLLNAEYASAIASAGDLRRAADAVKACEAALKIYTREESPADWAKIQLMLGQFLRAKPDGDRAENLERACAALDKALLVFNQKTFQQSGYKFITNEGRRCCFVAVETETKILDKR